MTRRKTSASFVCCLLCVVAWRARAAAPAVDDLLAKTPAKTVAEGQALAAELLKRGPAAIRAVCQKLIDPAEGQNLAGEARTRFAGRLAANAKARFALNGLAMFVSRPDAEAERTMYAGVLIGALAAEQRIEVRKFLIRQLQLAGKDEAVAPLAALLADGPLREPATQALVRIGTPKAIDALAKALPAAKGAGRVTFVQALGSLRAKAAAQAILSDAASQDTTLRRTALWALANIGAPSAGPVLAKAAEAKGHFERARATSCLLLYAQRAAEAGRKEECASLCRGLLKTRTAPGDRHAVCGALRTLALMVGADALPDLLAAAGHKDKQVRAATLKLAQRLPGEKVTAKWIDHMKQAPATVRAEILDMLGRRGDRTALPALLDALKDDDKAIRLAAIPAATRLAGTDALTPLLAVLDTDQADEIQAVRAALMRLSGDPVMPAIAKALPNVPTASRVALLEVLAARKAKAHVEAVAEAANDKDRAVRVAAIKALGVFADAKALPRLIAFLLAAKTSRESAAAQKVVVAVAKAIPEANKGADAVLAAMAKATTRDRATLLAVLARIGGSKALAAVLADTKSNDADLQNAAIRALAGWPDISAGPELLNIVRASRSLPHQVLALRGYVKLVGDSSLPPGRKVQMLKEAMTAARRSEEKKRVLAGLGAVRAVASLKLVAAFLDDDALAEEAAAAAVRIACPPSPKANGLSGPDAVAALKKVVAITKNKGLREKAQGYLDALPRPDALNLAQSKPVKTSVPAQGAQRPELAVDGNSADLRSAWFGARWPCWFQLDLGQPVKIDGAHVFFYWDGRRYYQYSLDVSLDAKTWTTAADRSKTTQPCTAKGEMLRFKPVAARYVRLSILKNSINEAVHLVELKVYAEGTAPKPPEPPRPDAKGFIPLFNGKDLTGWVGATKGYVPDAEGSLACLRGGNLYTEKEYGDFILRFEFKLTRNANNGLGIRTPLQGNPAYVGMELQILDNKGPAYKSLKPHQYHGSVYGVVPARRGFLKPVGEWNSQEVVAKGQHITVKLNGTTIVDADLGAIIKKGTTMDGRGIKGHPGLLRKKGHIGFLGHGSKLWFRNIRIKELEAPLNVPPPGFTALFNGKDLAGWKGLVGNPKTRARMTKEALARAQAAADGDMRKHWSIQDGALVFDGKGHSLCTAKDYADFEMLVDWKIGPGGDSGICLRGSPQVQIWDPAQHPEGSGGLSNNQKNPSKPLLRADNPVGEWNTFRIKMVGEKVTVHLNGKLVADSVTMENHWERGKPIYPTGQIELQSHGSTLYFRNLYIRELPKAPPTKGEI